MASQTEIEKLLKGTFSTDLGKKCLEHLENVYVKRPIYKAGLTFEETAFREGQANIVRQILGEVNGNR